MSEQTSKYRNRPADSLDEIFRKLGELGRAVVVVRSPGELASVNLVGTVYLGEDAGEPVIRVRESDDHIHLIWSRISGFTVEQESTPAGIEPVVWLMNEEREPVVRIFFPEKSIQELAALFATII